MLSNLPKNALNGSHHIVIDDKVETRRLASLGRLRRDTVKSPRPLNLLLGISDSLYYGNNIVMTLAFSYIRTYVVVTWAYLAIWANHECPEMLQHFCITSVHALKQYFETNCWNITNLIPQLKITSYIKNHGILCWFGSKY